MKRIVALMLLAVTLLCLVSASVTSMAQTTAPTEIPFTDVKENHWFYDEVVYAYTNGIFKGVTPTTFEPNTPMTRAMFVMTLANLDGATLTPYTDSEFTDVKENHWYASAVKWAVENKVASGVGNGRFDPNKAMTREQLAVMLYNYAKTKGVVLATNQTAIDGFSDKSKVSSWAKEAVLAAAHTELLTGTGEGILSPRGNSTRAQVARILMLYIEYSSVDFDDAVSVGSDRQLFLDEYLIDTESGDAYINIETPVKKEAVFTFDAEYEEADTVYHNIVKLPDGTYRMYYKATADIRRICYIESKDGLTWTRPQLTTNMYGGQPSNIVTLDDNSPDNLFVFYDTNPACPENQRIKGIYGQWGFGLVLEYSTGGTGDRFPFWRPGEDNEVIMMGTPTETEGCYFDSLNTVYWDENIGKYVAFVRGFHTDAGDYNLDATFVSENPDLVRRDIRVAYSDDCINWTIPVPLQYNTTDGYQLYTNAVIPYYRAPKTYVGMPTRFFESNSNYYTQIFFMSSRDLLNWNRTEKPYLTPANSQSYRYQLSGYPCIGYIETAPGEMSFYMKEKSSSRQSTVLYRYTLRVDGFMSAMGAELVTKPIAYEGDSLELNFEGEIKVTIRDDKGNLVRSQWMTGDEISKTIELGGALPKDGICILTFEMKEGTKLYSFKFN